MVWIIKTVHNDTLLYNECVIWNTKDLFTQMWNSQHTTIVQEYYYLKDNALLKDLLMPFSFNENS